MIGQGNISVEIEFASHSISEESSNLKQFVNSTIDLEPEWNYIAGVLINDLNGASIEMGVINLSTPALMGITLGWNYLDGVFSIISGLKLLTDDNDHRQSQNKIKGLLNILSGAQLFGLTYNPLIGNFGISALSPLTAMAGPAFAFAMLSDAVNSAIDFYNASKEMEFEGWLEEKLKEVQFVEQKLNNGLNHAEIASLVPRHERLIDEIGARSRVYCHSQNELKNSRKQFVENKCKIYLKENQRQENIVNFTSAPTQEDKKRNEDIQYKLNIKYEQSRELLILKTLSFVGMALLAISPFVACPPIGLLGLIITTAVAGYYLSKNSGKLLNGINNFFGRGNSNEPIKPEQNHRSLILG